MRNLLVFSLILSLISCKHEFIREKEVVQYLDQVHNIKLENKNIVILLQSNFCGSCTASTLDYLKNELGKFDLPIFIVMAKKRQDIVNKLSDSKIVFLTDDDFEYEKYGLRLTYDAMLFYENNTIKKWIKLDQKKLNKY